MGDVADLGNWGNPGAGVGTQLFKSVEGHGVEGDGIGGGQKDAWGGGVAGVKLTAPGKFDDQAVGNMEDSFGFDGIAGKNFADAGVLIGVRLHQAPRVIDTPEGQRGAAAVDAEIGITGHGSEVDQFGRLLGEDLGEIRPVRDFVGRLGEVGSGHAVHEGGLELQIPIDELTHGGVEVGSGVGIPAESGNVGAGAGLNRPDLDLAGFPSQGITGKDHVSLLLVPEGDLVGLEAGGNQAGGNGIGQGTAGTGPTISPGIDFDGHDVIGADAQGFPGIGGSGLAGQGGKEGGKGVFNSIRVRVVIVEKGWVFEVGDAGFRARVLGLKGEGKKEDQGYGI